MWCRSYCRLLANKNSNYIWWKNIWCIKSKNRKEFKSFKVARFSTGCAGVEVPNIGCVYRLPYGGYSPIKAGSEEIKKWDPEWAKYSWTSRYDNYWAGVKKACDELGMSLPDKSKLLSIREANMKDSSLGLPTSGWYWSSSERSYSDAYYVLFGNGNTYYQTKNDGSNMTILCVGD